MAGERFAQELEPPQCLLPESKQSQTGINEPSSCRTMRAQVFAPPAHPGVFCHVCTVQGWQICCLTELLLPSLLCKERCPGGFVSIWGSKFCVWGTVCSVYYKIDLSVNDADLYRGSGCLERKPWGDILHRGDNTVISVICMWYFWFRKGHFHCCLCPPDTLTPSFPGPGWQFCSNPNYCSLVCCPMKSSSIFASLCWS